MGAAAAAAQEKGGLSGKTAQRAVLEVRHRRQQGVVFDVVVDASLAHQRRGGAVHLVVALLLHFEAHRQLRAPTLVSSVFVLRIAGAVRFPAVGD